MAQGGTGYSCTRLQDSAQRYCLQLYYYLYHIHTKQSKKHWSQNDRCYVHGDRVWCDLGLPAYCTGSMHDGSYSCIRGAAGGASGERVTVHTHEWVSECG